MEIVKVVTVNSFTQEEIINGYKTGRKRQAVDFLVCPVCLKEYIVDDSFDKPWE